jgi:hypothetical protein
MAQLSLSTRALRPRKLTVIESGETFFGKHPVLAGYTINKAVPRLYGLSYRVIQSACTILKPFAGEIVMRPGQSSFSWEPIQWGHPSYSSDLVAHVKQVGRNVTQRLGVLGLPSLTGKVVCQSSSVCCSTSSSYVLWRCTRARSSGPLFAPTSRNCKCCNPSVFALQLTHLGTSVRSNLRIFGDSILCRPHQNAGWELWSKLADADNPFLSNRKSSTANQGLTEVTHGQPMRTDGQQASRRCPKIKTKSTQRLVSNDSLLASSNQPTFFS